MKMIQVGKEDFKLSLFVHDMIPYMKDSDDYTRKNLHLITLIIYNRISKLIFYSEV